MKDRSSAHVLWLREGPERTPRDLGPDSPAQLVDGHLGLRLRRPDPDVEGAALDLLLAHDDDVGDPLLSARRIFLASVSFVSSRSTRTSGNRSRRPRA